MTRRSAHTVRMAVLTALLVVCVSACLSASAWAAAEGPGWELSARSYPTNFSPLAPIASRVSGTIAVEVFNVGASAAGCTEPQRSRELEGEKRKVLLCPNQSHVTSNPITVTDVLPDGVKATEAGDLGLPLDDGTAGGVENRYWTCSGNGPGAPPRVAGATVVTCTNQAGEEETHGAFAGGAGAPTQGSGTHNPQPGIDIQVNVQPGAVEHELNRATIAGGGAPTSASTSDQITISSALPAPGAAAWDGWFSNADGTLDTQAGSHPYEATFGFDLANFLLPNDKAAISGGEIRTAEVELPPGLIGDPTAVPQCPRLQFDSEECPLESMIGTTTAMFANIAQVGVRVFNLVPPPGVPAEFGFSLQNLNTYLDASVRSGSDYGIDEHVSAIAHKEVVQAITTLWDNPGDPSHDRWRDGNAGGCAQEELELAGNPCTRSLTAANRPFLTLPTSCGNALPFVLKTTSWVGVKSERTFYMHDSNDNATSLGGCENLAFAPLLSAAAQTAGADLPSGLSVDVTPPLGGLQQVEGLSSADIENTTVTLPRGFVANPGQAAGLQACQPSQDGLTSEAEQAAGQEDSGPPSCPAASKIGTARAKSPLLEGAGEKELEGSVYVLQSNPPHLKLLAALAADGVNVKLVLDAELNEQTGQISTRVIDAPQLPVSDFKLTLDGGATAALDTPTRCGSYQATADFTPWSAPLGSDFATSSAIGIVAGADGGSCPGSPLPFAPSLTAGSGEALAGAFTSFSTTLARGDGQQRIERLQFKAPAGLAGMIASVPLCAEPQAAQGTCSPASRIGHVTAQSGAGANPLTIPQPGEPEPQIYLTGPYQGAPFGLSIVTRLLAGPFDLGTIVTRARIEVDPHSAQVIVTSDPLPQIIDGVPTDLRSVSAVIDRPGFMFNPTDCMPSSFVGSATGASAPGSGEAGASAPIASRFVVGGCRALAFNPSFSVSTSGKTSKANGASLTAKLSYPNAPQGTQANITRVKVDLPKQLPSRLTTLQKACTNAQFEANPAGCPSASVIGHARVVTPLLPVPVEGPAYFVSHGGEAFPSLIMLLQGDGVTVELVGTTFISKAGITSSTFKTVPDVPFSTFTLTLPQGRYSALAANLPVKDHGSFCGQVLTMPTAFVAQNGTEIHRSTKIGVSGCKAPKKVSKKTKKKRRAGKK
jgi:hypothetical protein